MNAATSRVAVALVLLAVIVRGVFAAIFLAHPIGGIVALDTEEYRALAADVRAARFDAPAFDYLNPPYAFVLAPFVAQPPARERAAVALVQIAMDGLTVLLLFEVGRRLLSRRAAVVGAALYACYGAAVFYSAVELPVTLSALTVMLALGATVYAAPRPPSWAALPGVALAMLALVRPNALVLVPVILAWMVVVARRAREGRARVALRGAFLMLGLVTVLAPWSVRGGRLSPFPVNGGINFYIGTGPGANGRYAHVANVADRPGEQVRTSVEEASRRAGRPLDAAEASAFWFDEGLRWAADTPGAALRLVLRKAGLFFRAEEPSLNINYEFARARLPLLRATLPMGAILPLTLWGLASVVLAAGTRRDEKAWLPVLFVAAYATSVIAFFIADRYRMPIAPVLALLAGHGAVTAWEARRAHRAGPAVIGLVLAGVAVNYPFTVFRYDDDAASYVRLSDVYCEQGRLDEALAECEKGAALAPNTPDVLFCFANAFYFKKDYFRAEMALRATLESLEHTPADVPARRNLVWLYREQQLFADALRESVDPEERTRIEDERKQLAARVGDLAAYARAQYETGERERAAGRRIEARYAFKRALSADPRLSEAQSALAAVAREMGLPD